MRRCTELTPSFRPNGDIERLAAHSLSSFVPDPNSMALQSIELNIEFTDRRPLAFRERTKPTDPRKERLHRRNALKSKESAKPDESAKSGSGFLNLPDLEPAVTASVKGTGSMSMSPPIKRRKLNDGSTEKEVIGISEDEESARSLSVRERAVHWVKVDDLRLEFFLCSFPQLLTTHHLVHCHQAEHEWIQTDSQIIDIVHRFVAEHDGSPNGIALSFQIRPRADTKSDAESMENHKQFMLDRLLQIDRVRKDHGGAPPKRRRPPMDHDEEELFLVHSQSEDDGEGGAHRHHRYAAIYNDDSQHLLMEEVIAAIHQNEDGHGDGDGDELGGHKKAASSSPAVGSWHSGLCGLCHRKYAPKDRRDEAEQQWIECGVCTKWYHQRCSGLDDEQYAAFIHDERRKYRCLICSEQ